jgi:acyl carrier protein
MSEADRLVALIADALDVPVDSLTLQSGSPGLEAWDSLAHLRILMMVEEEFGISVDMEAAAELDSISAIVDYIRRSQRR